MESPETVVEKSVTNGSTLDKIINDIRKLGKDDSLAQELQEKIEKALEKRHQTAQDILESNPEKFNFLEDVYEDIAKQPDKPMKRLSILLLSTNDEEKAKKILRQMGALEEGQSLSNINLQEEKGVRHGEIATRHERASVKIIEENGKRKKVTVTLSLNPAASLEAMKRYERKKDQI